MTAADKRLQFLEKAVQGGSRDTMALYGLAMEYRSRGRVDDALRTFVTLREAHPDYVPTFLMTAQMLAEAARPDDARTWAEAGVAAAKAKGDSHALGELESFLGTLA